MLETAVVDLGLSPDEFWELSWYEWGLYALRYKRMTEDKKFLFETGWDQTRQLWAVLINSHSSKKVKPGDLIKLSYDKKELKRKTPEEVAKKFKPKL